MTQKFYTMPMDYYTDWIIGKFQVYVIVDIENKIKQLLITGTRDEFFDEKISKLMDERTCYEKASKVQLLDDLIMSAKERALEDDIDVKAIFDLTLSREQFSSYH